MYNTLLKIYAILHVVGCLLLSNIPVALAQDNIRESQIKVAFIYNIARMVEWPLAENDLDIPFRICSIGRDYFGDTFDILKDRRVRGKPLLIEKNVTLTEALSCHILFINESEKDYLATILSALYLQPILTIGDFDDFAQQGGIINLVKQRERLKVEVNLRAAQRAQLTISSRLLSVATIVEQ